MKKLWMLLVSIVLCFVACDMPATGGNPGEGSPCKGVTKNHANKYYFELTLKCQYEEKCFYFCIPKSGHNNNQHRTTY